MNTSAQNSMMADKAGGTAAAHSGAERDRQAARQRRAVERVRRGYRSAGLAGLAGLVCSSAGFVAGGGVLDPWRSSLWAALALTSALAIAGRYLIQDRPLAPERLTAWRVAFGLMTLLGAILWGAALGGFSEASTADGARISLIAAAIGAAMLVASLFYQPLLLAASAAAVIFAAWATEWQQGLGAGSAAFLWTGMFGGALLLTGLMAALAGRRSVDDAVALSLETEALQQLRSELGARSEHVRDAVMQKQELQQDLRSARQEAEQASRAKTEFLAMMSHEIRTPLNGIVPILELLRDGRLNGEQAKLVSVAHQSSRQLLRIINDILDFAKAESGKLELEDIELSLRDIAGSVAELMANSAARKGLSLSLIIDEALPFYLRGDPIRLRQILTNLVSNAVKFTERGSIRLEIEVQKAGRKDLDVRFSVADTGMGMSPQTAARLFTSFTQADASTTRKHGGTGLGLAISKHLVDLMGGEIGVESLPGQGSTFWFVLPMRRSVTDVPIRRKTLEEARVLLLAGQIESIRRYREQLGDWGMLVEQAMDLDEVVAKLKSSAMLGRSWVYELLLIDADGFERDLPALCKRLAGLDGLQDMSIVVLTGSARLVEELELGGNGLILQTPVNREQLRRNLYRLLDVEGHGGSGEHLGGEPPPPPQVLDPLLNRDPEPVPAQAPVQAVSGRVLLVEDNPVNLSVARRLLSRLGLVCEVAEHGREALAKVERGEFDLIFMDVQMPVMDGYEATRMIRARETEHGAPRTPVIAMTANAMAGDREKCLAAGMDDYVAKPVSAERLQELVQVWLARPEVVLPKTAEAGRESRPAFRAPSSAVQNPAGRGSPPADISGPAAEFGVRDAAVIDAGVIDELVEVMGDDLGGLIRTYLDNGASYLQRVRAAVGAGDVEAAVLPLHSLKSSSANVGAMQLYEVAKVLEQSARAGRLEEVEAGVAPLAEQFRNAAAELRGMTGAASTA